MSEAQSRPSTPPEQVIVVRGDTLYGIAFRHGLDWRDLARWNGLGSPTRSFPARSWRLVPPERERVSVARMEPSLRGCRATASATGGAPAPRSPPPAAGSAAAASPPPALAPEKPEPPPASRPEQASSAAPAEPRPAPPEPQDRASSRGRSPSASPTAPPLRPRRPQPRSHRVCRSGWQRASVGPGRRRA